MTLNIQSDEFIHSLTPKDKKIVEKAINLYNDFIDYKDALRISKAIENGTIKSTPADEVFRRLDKKFEA